MEFFQSLNTSQKLMWTIGIALIADSIQDQSRIIFNVYPDNLVLSGILGVTTVIFAGLFTGVFFIEDGEEVKG